MQWRVLTLLLAGLVVIYLASLLQDTPYPHPAKMKIDRHHLPGTFPDTSILSVQPNHLYEAMIYFGHNQNDQVMSGTGDMKTGVFGKIKLLRRPIQFLLQHQDGISTEDEWTNVLEHTLRGHITKISGPPSATDSPLQFAVLYHTVENETPRYYTRVYYLANDTGSFEYKDLVFPGTTWIKSFVIEKDSIIFSRDPDIYRYRIIRLPNDLTKAPHSENAQDIILSASEPGYRISPNYHLTDQVEKHENVLSRLYSPILDTFRVVSLDIYKARTNFHVSVSVADNASSVTQLSELRGETPVDTWHLREHNTRKGSYYEDDFLDSNGVLDMSQSSENRLQMPPLSLTRSTDARTVAFPITRSQFTTLDYTDKVDILQKQQNSKRRLYRNSEDGAVIPEYYYWPMDGNEEIYDVYDGDIYGLEINEAGTLLAVWTEHNFIYIYKRGSGDDHVLQQGDIDDTEKKKYEKTSSFDQATETNKPVASPTLLPIKPLSLIDQLDIFLGFRLPPPPSDIKSQYQHPYSHPDLPARWFLRMVITPNERNPRQSRISTVTFFNASSSQHGHTGNNYLLVGLKTGALHSYLIDAMEPPQKIGLGSFIIGQWDMLIAMCVIIAVFAFNEYQHYGGV
ncbi:uncharacterized protein BX664DRAFT_388710 [Halteromyces radiatus]|uniref:uncharacterized protein n=1 Tax=Halteromyces radiatus TaxID=101107 RepID=UPI0022211AD7|nr:uncharacterized protein BX664DRAFT_388710 [Halteromyces radiatus]KAI8081784.1 hypothetical protein BX664DRAFT_388710 [Halteromyces radiatus]